MPFLKSDFYRSGHMILAATLVALLTLAPREGAAQVTAFKQAVAETASRDDDVAAFYRSRNFDGIWTGAGDVHRARRAALLDAMARAGDHGLPVNRYDVSGLKTLLRNATNPRARGIAEVEMSKAFLAYARDIQTGALKPSKVDSSIVRKVQYRDRTKNLADFSVADPNLFLRGLAPRTIEYTALMSQKLKMEEALRNGGWGARVGAKSLKPGNSGQAVVQLRNRLMAMGHLGRTNAQVYDAAMANAVQRFQAAHGLEADGEAGSTTINALNQSVETRLKSVLVALERERWFNQPRGDRHILVNLPEFTAKVVDHGKVTFRTRSVIGANKEGRLTPEFSDTMEYMVINPSWFVPRSIVTKEYLPALQRNPNSVSHLRITDSRGREVNRGAVNFSAYSAKTFPFSMRQPPGKSNALGIVKFIFPNKHNIYLHDTPSKSLFGRTVRAFSHGCVRLADPKDFAYHLLAKQSDSPKELFQRHLRSGVETKVPLETQLPVHIIYRTAFANDRGEMNYRADIYGRDKRIWSALQRAGVALPGLSG